MKLLIALIASLSVALPLNAADSAPAVRARVDAEYPRLFDLYKHLHANPEISFQEVKTAARIADELKQAGFDVTTKVGVEGRSLSLEIGRVNLKKRLTSFDRSAFSE